MRGEGRAVLLPEDVDTDVIIAGRYLRTKDATVWAEHALEDLDPTLARRLDGAVIVAGKNFGCGSSREQAPIALKGAGVKAVVAPSFARIFFRNAINVGLPVLEGTVGCAEGEVVTFDLDGAWVACGDERVDVRRLSDRMLDIIRAGGLVEYVKGRE